MSFEWKHEGQWTHKVTLTNGKVLKPLRIVLDSAVRDSPEKCSPALFAEIKDPEGFIGLNWIRWDEIEKVESRRV